MIALKLLPVKKREEVGLPGSYRRDRAERCKQEKREKATRQLRLILEFSNFTRFTRNVDFSLPCHHEQLLMTLKELLHSAATFPFESRGELSNVILLATLPSSFFLFSMIS